MGKQYTFKTTKDTEWLESLLDSLPSAERSRHIRMALSILFDDKRPAVRHSLPLGNTSGQTVPQEVLPKVTPPEPKEVPEVTPPPTLEEPIFEEGIDEEVDLDAKLNNMDFNNLF